MAERVVARIYGDGSELFVYLPAAIRNRYEILVGDRLYCVVQGVSPPNSQGVSEVRHEGWWEIKGYWHELHILPTLVEQFDLRPGQYLTLRLQEVCRGKG